jgi:DNA-binding NarL/FixJ family response regulator
MGKRSLLAVGSREWTAGKGTRAVVRILSLIDLISPRFRLEVLQALKSHDAYKRIPVVVLTTSREDADVNRAYTLGANSYIVKPVDFARFTEVAEQVQRYWMRSEHAVQQATRHGGVTWSAAIR